MGKIFLHTHAHAHPPTPHPKLLYQLLKHISETLKTKLRIQSISSIVPTVKIIDHLHLTVGGGDPVDGSLIRDAFSLLTSVGVISIRQLIKNDDIFYLFNNLTNRIIILNPATRESHRTRKRAR